MQCNGNIRDELAQGLSIDDDAVYINDDVLRFLDGLDIAMVRYVRYFYVV